jgi:surfeit locus 1 family protein
MFRFLLRPRWIALGIFAVVMSVLCVRLGFWQLDRLHGRRYYNHLFEQGMTTPAQPVEHLIDGAPGNAPLLYAHATATGTYDTAHEMILYGRMQDDQPGNHVLTPLRLADGRAVVVDRGWVPFDMDTPPVTAATPPTGTVTVTGLLDPSVPDPTPHAGNPTTFAHVDLQRIGALLPYPVLPYYVQLQQQSPAQPDRLPVPPPAPELDDGPHLGYALQWFSFATIAGLGFLLLVVREVLDGRRATVPPAAPAEAAP